MSGGRAPSSALILGREPAAWISVADAGLILVVAFGLSLSDDQTGAIIAALTAVLSVATAWATRPVAPALFVGVVKTGLALVVAFGLSVSAGQQGAILAFTTVVLALLVRQQVAPLASVNAVLPAPVLAPEAGRHEVQ